MGQYVLKNDYIIERCTVSAFIPYALIMIVSNAM